jgi:hypothetical protein
MAPTAGANISLVYQESNEPPLGAAFGILQRLCNMAICAFADTGPRRADPHDLQASQIVQKLVLSCWTCGEWQKSPDQAFRHFVANSHSEPKADGF